MKSVLLRRFTVVLAVLVLVGSLVIPTQAVAQGNGRGRGQAKKVDKFVNGHDARDGRLDGRGPRPRLLGTTRRVRNRALMTRRRMARRNMVRRQNRARVVRVR